MRSILTSRIIGRGFVRSGFGRTFSCGLPRGIIALLLLFSFLCGDPLISSIYLLGSFLYLHNFLPDNLLNLLQMMIDLSFFFDFSSPIAWTFLLLLVLTLLALEMLLLLHLLEHIDALKFFLLLLEEALDLHIHVLNFVL